MARPVYSRLTIPILATLVLLAPRPGFAAEQAIKPMSANTVSVEQFSREIAAQLVRPGTLSDPLSPVQQQQMQRSLETYFHTLFAELLGSGGISAGKKGICLTQQLAQCNSGDAGVPEDVGICVGRDEANCTSKAGTKFCQDAKTLKKYTVDLKCRWVKTP